MPGGAAVNESALFTGTRLFIAAADEADEAMLTSDREFERVETERRKRGCGGG